MYANSYNCCYRDPGQQAMPSFLDLLWSLVFGRTSVYGSE